MAEARAVSPREDDALVEVAGLAKLFDVSPPLLNRLLQGQQRVLLTAVDDVSFKIPRGKTFSLVGESGCGKSTVARLVVGLHNATRGKILFEGADMAGLKGRAETEPLRKRLQMIFQDPYASLNPRWRVADIIAEPIRAHKTLSGRRVIAARVGELLEVSKDGILREVKVLGLLEKRVGAPLVPSYMEDLTPPERFERQQETVAQNILRRDSGLGRPTKRDRRDIERLFGD